MHVRLNVYAYNTIFGQFHHFPSYTVCASHNHNLIKKPFDNKGTVLIYISCNANVWSSLKTTIWIMQFLNGWFLAIQSVSVCGRCFFAMLQCNIHNFFYTDKEMNGVVCVCLLSLCFCIWKCIYRQFFERFFFYFFSVPRITFMANAKWTLQILYSIYMCVVRVEWIHSISFTSSLSCFLYVSLLSHSISFHGSSSSQAFHQTSNV